LAAEGRAPVASLLHSHRWFDAPPLRLLSIRDFEEFGEGRSFTIERRVALDSTTGVAVSTDAERNADLAIFVLERGTA